MPEHSEHSEDLSAVTHELWEQEQPAYDVARQLATRPQEEIFTPEELAEAFSGETKVYIGCMDERVQVFGMKKIGVGGSCVLMSDEQVDALVQKLLQRGIHVEFVTCHDGCGACKHFCTTHNVSGELAEQLPMATAISLTKRMGIKHEPMQVPASAMTGNIEIHHARGIVVDCSGRFRPEALNKAAEPHMERQPDGSEKYVSHTEKRKFPSSFELTAAAYPDLACFEEEFRFALSIAEGGHGMGERFDATKGGQKLLLTFVEDPNDPGLTAAIGAIVRKVALEHQRTVMLVTLTAPNTK